MPINERLNLSVSFGGAVKATATTTIIDTSLPAYEYILVGSNPSSTEIYQSDAPTYLLSSNVSTVNEGDAITFTLNTTMLDTGTIIPYTITGVSVSDISLSTLTGNFVTDATGKATLSFSIINDIATEGNETLILTLNALNVSKSVIINDTSMMPTYVAGWYGNSTGTTGVLSSVDEGQHAYLVVKTTNVPNGTVLNVTLTGGINVADLAEVSLSTTITVTNNIAYRLYNTKIDETTEGNEIVNASVYLDSNLVATANLTINDTSTAPITSGVIDVVGIFVKTETYSSKSYDIGWGVNAYDYFVSKIGRAPFAGENISFNVGSSTALVATNTSVGALHFDNRFNNVGSLTLSNSGIVLGHGKRGRGPSEVANQEDLRGGAALLNTSSITINTTNSGIIAGGGGGGASVSGSFNNVEGGDGAPWGRDDTSISFTTVTSSSTNAGGGRFPGTGGNWGEYGQQNSENDYYNYGYPGYVMQGLGTINNINGGITRGR